MTQEKALQILQSGVNVFLTGEAGSGKTYTLKKYVEWCRDNYKRVAVTATTGTAAMQFEGRTIHSLTGMGHDANTIFSDSKVYDLATKPWIEKDLRGLDVIIIDEISMLTANALFNVERILSAVTGEEPFGGVQVVLVGDFFQLPPVWRKDSEDPKPEFAFKSAAWAFGDFTVCYLTEQHRQNDMKFNAMLNHLRDGTFSKEDLAYLHSAQNTENHANESTKLYATNSQVDTHNNAELAKLKGQVHTFMMKADAESSLPVTSQKFIIDFMKKNCPSPEILRLKVGALVMFTQNNYDRDNERMIWANGTLGKVVDFRGDLPVIEMRDGPEHIIGLADWEYKNKGKVVATIRQIPLRLAWAVTIHKSQGMTLDKLTVDLSNAFEAGMEYVALSRVRSLDSLHLLGFHNRVPEMHPEVIKQDKIFRNA